MLVLNPQHNKALLPEKFFAALQIFRRAQRWEICGGGYGIHWPDLDEDFSIEGLLRGAPAPNK